MVLAQIHIRAKKMEFNPDFVHASMLARARTHTHTHTHTPLKIHHRPKWKTQNYKILHENHCDLGLCKDFLDITPKA